MARTGMVLWDKLSDETIKNMCSKMPRTGSKESGQNPMWATQNALYRLLLEEDVDQFRAVVNKCLAVNLAVVGLNEEGVQVDNSYHCHGNMLYSNGYGLSQVQDLANWVYLLYDTSFALPEATVDLLATTFLDGTRWMFRGDILEIGQCYKKIWSLDTSFYQDRISSLEKLVIADPKHAEDYQAAIDNLTGKRKDNGLRGNKYMWTSAVMAHMEEDYGINVKFDHAGMKSAEWRTEWKEACTNFWSSAGALMVTVDGDEYRRAFPTYDWRHMPGTTTPYYYSDRFNDFDNGNDDVIGASNGEQGAVSYVYAKTDVRKKTGDEYSGGTTGGKLSYFFFGDEYVALGTDLHSNHKMPIHSTINQVKSENPSVNGVAVPAETYDVAYEADWVYNDQIAYIFPETTTVKVGNQDQKDKYINNSEQYISEDDVFTLWIDHGVMPTNGSYAYIALPGVTEAEGQAYAESNPITILSNTEEVQAVSHSGLKQTHVCFYGPGEFEYATGKTIRATEACTVIIDESGATPVITMAVSNTKQNTNCEVFLTIDGDMTRTAMKSGADPYAGQSVTLTAGDSTLITSGESTADSSLGLAFDGDADTTWTAATLADSYIEYDMQTALDLTSVTVNWGDNYAKAYEILTSADSETWTSAYTTTAGDGGEDVISISANARYWKLVVTDTANGGGVQIKDIRFEDKDFPYATPTYPDISLLKTEIDEIIKTNLYSEETLAVYYAAIDKGNKLLVLPYATDEMVSATIEELQTAKENLTLRDLGSVMATVKLNPNVLQGQKQTLATNWTNLDKELDLYDRDLSKIYLFFTMDVECDDFRSSMFSSGRFMLRSPNTDGKENSVYILVSKFQIQEGENIFYIPLTDLTGKNNEIDWEHLTLFRLYVDSLNQYDIPIKLTFSDIQILDSEHRPEDSADKLELKQLLKTQQTELEGYTPASVNAYNMLFREARNIYRSVAATDDKVKDVLTRMRTAEDVLKLDDPAKDVVGTLLAGEKKSGEGHLFKVEFKSDAPIDISAYETGKVYLQFDLKIDTANPNPADGWLRYVRNGRLEVGQNKQVARDVLVKTFHATDHVAAGGTWFTLRYALPQALVEKGEAQIFYLSLYNDTNALGTDEGGYKWSNNSGVTMVVRNARIVGDAVVMADKTALNTAITAAETVTDLSGYTEESVQAFADALANAKVIAEKEDATQSEVDAANAALTAAQNGLTAKTPVVLLGDVDKDGNVAAADALLALQIATGKIAPDATQKTAADVDGKDGVTANDALLILQYATRKITVFPAEPEESIEDPDALIGPGDGKYDTGLDN